MRKGRREEGRGGGKKAARREGRSGSEGRKDKRVRGRTMKERGRM